MCRVVTLFITVACALAAQVEGPLEFRDVPHRRQLLKPESFNPAALLDRAKTRSQEFTANLPNFVCAQVIRRHAGRSNRDWVLRDTITAEVMYVNRRERYRNVKRNGEDTDWLATQRTGTWSEGEYGSILRDLFSPTTAARFAYNGEDVIRGVPLLVYNYEVARDNSHWTVSYEGRMVQPAYRGRVWVDPREGFIRRIEMEAVDLPRAFPINYTEMTLEYGTVPINGQPYLLPTRSENLACFTVTNSCSRNEIEFRDYQKFSAEVNIRVASDTLIQ